MEDDALEGTLGEGTFGNDVLPERAVTGMAFGVFGGTHVLKVGRRRPWPEVKAFVSLRRQHVDGVIVEDQVSKAV